MESLHERGLIHRDLKPGNFILVPKTYSDVSVLAQTPTPRAQFVYRLVDKPSQPKERTSQPSMTEAQAVGRVVTPTIMDGSAEPLLAEENREKRSSSSANSVPRCTLFALEEDRAASSAPCKCKSVSSDAADLEVLVQHPTSRRTVAIPLIIKVSDFGTGQRLNNVVNNGGEQQGQHEQAEGPGQHVSHLSVFGMAGTVIYMPPEVVRQTPDGKKILSKRADVWALGIMLFQMLHEGKTPFDLFRGFSGAPEALMAVASETVNNEVIPKQFAEGRKKLWEAERRRVLAGLRGLSWPCAEVEEVLRSLVEAWMRLEFLFRLCERCLAFSVEDRVDCADLSKLMNHAAEAGWGVRGLGEDGVSTRDDICPALVAVLEGIMGSGEDAGAESRKNAGREASAAGQEGSPGRKHGSAGEEGNAGQEEGSSGREGNAGREAGAGPEGNAGGEGTEETIFSALDMEVARIGDMIGARLFPEVWVSRASAAASVCINEAKGRKTVRGPFFGLFDTRFGQVLALIILIVIAGGLCGGVVAAVMGSQSWSPGTAENYDVVGPTSGTSGPETPHVSVVGQGSEPSMGQVGPFPTVSPPNRTPGFLDGGGGNSDAGAAGGAGGAGGSAERTGGVGGAEGSVGTGGSARTVSDRPGCLEGEGNGNAGTGGNGGAVGNIGTGVGGAGGSDPVKQRETVENVEAKVSKNGLALQNIDPLFQNNKQVVLAATKENPSAFQYASAELKKDREFVGDIVRLHPSAFQYASAGLRGGGDRDFVIAIVRLHPSAFEYASDRWKADPLFVRDIVRLYSDANERAHLARLFSYASDTLKKDRVFALDVVRENSDVLAWVSDELRADPEFVLEAVRQTACAFRYASDELKRNKDFVLKAVHAHTGVLFCVSDNDKFRADPGFMLEVVRSQPKAFRHVSDELKADRGFVLEAVRVNAGVFDWISDELKADPEVVCVSVWATRTRCQCRPCGPHGHEVVSVYGHTVWPTPRPQSTPPSTT